MQRDKFRGRFVSFSILNLVSVHVQKDEQNSRNISTLSVQVSGVKPAAGGRNESADTVSDTHSWLTLTTSVPCQNWRDSSFTLCCNMLPACSDLWLYVEWTVRHILVLTWAEAQRAGEPVVTPSKVRSHCWTGWGDTTDSTKSQAIPAWKLYRLNWYFTQILAF